MSNRCLRSGRYLVFVRPEEGCAPVAGMNRQVSLTSKQVGFRTSRLCEKFSAYQRTPRGSQIPFSLQCCGTVFGYTNCHSLLLYKQNATLATSFPLQPPNHVHHEDIAASGSAAGHLVFPDYRHRLRACSEHSHFIYWHYAYNFCRVWWIHLHP